MLLKSAFRLVSSASSSAAPAGGAVSNSPESGGFARKKLFIDRVVQGSLAARVVAYHLLGLAVSFLLLIGAPLVIGLLMAEKPPSVFEIAARAWSQYWPAVTATILVLPMIVADIVRVSHRFVGPVFKTHAIIRRLADGEPVERVRFRKHDFWGDSSSDLNRLIERIAKLEKAAQANPRIRRREENGSEQASLAETPRRGRGSDSFKAF